MLTPQGLPRQMSIPPGIDPYEFSQRFYNPMEVKHRRRTSKEQFKVLEDTFHTNPKPNSQLRKSLGLQLGMPPRNVQVWFQNRRAKAKSQRLREQRQAPLANMIASPSPISNSNPIPNSGPGSIADHTDPFEEEPDMLSPDAVTPPPSTPPATRVSPDDPSTPLASASSSSSADEHPSSSSPPSQPQPQSSDDHATPPRSLTVDITSANRPVSSSSASTSTAASPSETKILPASAPPASNLTLDIPHRHSPASPNDVGPAPAPAISHPSLPSSSSTTTTSTSTTTSATTSSAPVRLRSSAAHTEDEIVLSLRRGSLPSPPNLSAHIAALNSAGSTTSSGPHSSTGSGWARASLGNVRNFSTLSRGFTFNLREPKNGEQDAGSANGMRGGSGSGNGNGSIPYAAPFAHPQLPASSLSSSSPLSASSPHSQTHSYGRSAARGIGMDLNSNLNGNGGGSAAAFARRKSLPASHLRLPQHPYAPALYAPRSAGLKVGSGGNSANSANGNGNGNGNDARDGTPPPPSLPLSQLPLPAILQSPTRQQQQQQHTTPTQMQHSTSSGDESGSNVGILPLPLPLHPPTTSIQAQQGQGQELSRPATSAGVLSTSSSLNNPHHPHQLQHHQLQQLQLQYPQHQQLHGQSHSHSHLNGGEPGNVGDIDIHELPSNVTRHGSGGHERPSPPLFPLNVPTPEGGMGFATYPQIRSGSLPGWAIQPHHLNMHPPQHHQQHTQQFHHHGQPTSATTPVSASPLGPGTQQQQQQQHALNAQALAQQQSIFSNMLPYAFPPRQLSEIPLAGPLPAANFSFGNYSASVASSSASHSHSASSVSASSGQGQGLLNPGHGNADGNGSGNGNSTGNSGFGGVDVEEDNASLASGASSRYNAYSRFGSLASLASIADTEATTSSVAGLSSSGCADELGGNGNVACGDDEMGMGGAGAGSAGGMDTEMEMGMGMGMNMMGVNGMEMGMGMGGMQMGMGTDPNANAVALAEGQFGTSTGLGMMRRFRGFPTVQSSSSSNQGRMNGMQLSYPSGFDPDARRSSCPAGFVQQFSSMGVQGQGGHPHHEIFGVNPFAQHQQHQQQHQPQFGPRHHSPSVQRPSFEQRTFSMGAPPPQQSYDQLKALSMTAGAAVAAATQFLERQQGNGGSGGGGADGSGLTDAPGSSSSSEHSGSSVTPPAVPREAPHAAQSPTVSSFADTLTSFDIGTSHYFMSHQGDGENSLMSQLSHQPHHHQHIDPNDIHFQRRPSVPLLYTASSLAGALSQS